MIAVIWPDPATPAVTRVIVVATSGAACRGASSVNVCTSFTPARAAETVDAVTVPAFVDGVTTVKPATFVPARAPTNSTVNPVARPPVTVTLPDPTPLSNSIAARTFVDTDASLSPTPIVAVADCPPSRNSIAPNVSGPKARRYVVFSVAAGIAGWLGCNPRLMSSVRLLPATVSVSIPMKLAKPAVACKLVKRRDGSARSVISANAKLTCPSDKPT